MLIRIFYEKKFMQVEIIIFIRYFIELKLSTSI